MADMRYFRKQCQTEKMPAEPTKLICQLLIFELIISEKSSCFTAGSCCVLLAWRIDFIENDKYEWNENVWRRRAESVTQKESLKQIAIASHQLLFICGNNGSANGCDWNDKIITTLPSWIVSKCSRIELSQNDCLRPASSWRRWKSLNSQRALGPNEIINLLKINSSCACLINNVGRERDVAQWHAQVVFQFAVDVMNYWIVKRESHINRKMGGNRRRLRAWLSRNQQFGNLLCLCVWSVSFQLREQFVMSSARRALVERKTMATANFVWNDGLRRQMRFEVDERDNAILDY